MQTKEKAIQTLIERGQHEAAQAVRDGAFVALTHLAYCKTTVYSVMEPTRTLDNPDAREHHSVTFSTYAVPCGDLGMRRPGDLFKGLPVGPERTAAVQAYYAGLAEMCHQIIKAFYPAVVDQPLKVDGHRLESIE